MINDQDGETNRILIAGRPEFEQCDNTVKTSKYTILSFLPVVGNVTLEEFHYAHYMKFKTLISPFLILLLSALSGNRRLPENNFVVFQTFTFLLQGL